MTQVYKLYRIIDPWNKTETESWLRTFLLKDELCVSCVSSTDDLALFVQALMSGLPFLAKNIAVLDKIADLEIQAAGKWESLRSKNARSAESYRIYPVTERLVSKDRYK